MFNFEKFPVYIKSEQVYSILVQRILLDQRIDQSMKNQLRKAASSIPLNIAEGAAKFSSKDKKNYYLIARGSVQECVSILRLLKIEGILSDQGYNDLYERFVELSRMLSGMINNLLQRIERE